MEKVTIRFGTQGEIVAEKNGSSYIVENKPEFPEDLSVVTVSGEEPQTFHDAQIVECASVDGRYWFTIIETSASEKESLQVEQNTANIDYLSAMTGIDL